MGIFCCGAQCGITSAGPSPGASAVQHWTNNGTTPPFIDEDVTYLGSRTYLFSPLVAATSFLRKFLPVTPNPSVLVASFSARLDSPLSAKVNIFEAAASFGSYPMIMWNQATGKWAAGFGLSTPVDGPTAVLGRWYTFEVRFTVTGSTWTIEWRVDGVAQTQVTKTGQSANFLTDFSIGPREVAVTGALHMAGLFVSVTAADYPLGNIKVVPLRPSRDGTHSFLAGDFKYNNTTTILLSATDVYTYLDDRNVGGPNLMIDDLTGVIDSLTGVIDSLSVTDTIAMVVLTPESYIEVGFQASPVGTILGIEIVSGSHATDISSNAQTLLLVSGALTYTIYESADFSQLTIVTTSTHLPLDLTDNAWAKAIVDALLIRWGFTTDNVPAPLFDSIMMEVPFKVPYLPAPGQAIIDGIKTVPIDGEGASLGDSVIPAGGRLLLTVSDGLFQGDAFGKTFFSFPQGDEGMKGGELGSQFVVGGGCSTNTPATTTFDMYTPAEVVFSDNTSTDPCA